MTRDFLVSNEIFNFGNFFLRNFTIFFILFHSTNGFISLEPGLVDSPPISIILAQESIKNSAFFIAFFLLK